MSTNYRWFLDVNHWARETAGWHDFFKAYATWAGFIAIAVLLLVGYVVARGDGRAERLAASLWSGLAAPVAWGLNQPIVSGWDAKRPYVALANRHPLLLVSRSHDPSAPSDHTVVMTAAAVALAFVAWRLALVALPFALFMGFARIYVGAHFPVDVAAGIGVGAFIAIVGWFALRVLLRRVILLLRRTPLLRIAVAG